MSRYLIDIRTKPHWSFPNLLNANVRSITPKVDELSTVLQINNIDIACLTETWLKDEISSDVVTVKGYVSHRKDRSDGRRGGGVAVYVRDHFLLLLLLLQMSRFE